MPGERINGERVRRSVGERRGLRLQVNRHMRAWRHRELFQQRRVRGGRKSDGKQSRLERVVSEDVGEAGADDGAKAEIEQCPWRVLAGSAAAEVVARDKDRRAACVRRIQRKLGA